MTKTTKNFFTIEQAKQFLEKNHPEIKTVAQWFEYSSSEARDKLMPSNPMVHYKKLKQWPCKDGWAWFLGSNNVSNKSKSLTYLSYAEACSFNQTFKIRDKASYREFIQEHNIKDLPLAPEKFYVKSESIQFSWKEYLAPKFLSKEEFLAFFKTLEIKSYKEWQAYAKKKPSFIPSNPFAHYGLKFNDIVSISKTL